MTQKEPLLKISSSSQLLSGNVELWWHWFRFILRTVLLTLRFSCIKMERFQWQALLMLTSFSWEKTHVIWVLRKDKKSSDSFWRNCLCWLFREDAKWRLSKRHKILRMFWKHTNKMEACLDRRIAMLQLLPVTKH